MNTHENHNDPNFSGETHGTFPRRTSDDELQKLRELKKQVEASAGLKCPNCDDVGFSVEAIDIDECEQVQCEFCYTVEHSIFNREMAKTAMTDGT